MSSKHKSTKVNDFSDADLILLKSKVNLPEFDEAAKKGNLDWTAVGIIKKAAKSCTDKDFITFVRGGEIPAIKFTSQEMEMIKGGGWLSKLVGAISLFLNSKVL